jgi:hypothetical protein
MVDGGLEVLGQISMPTYIGKYKYIEKWVMNVRVTM